jgi:hypothetical protein
MKKFSFLLSIFLIGLFIASCSQSTKTSNEAKSAMEAVVKELAKDPSSVNLADVNVVYENDSLSIIHFELTAKNGLGMDLTNKMEYIYLVQGESKFEGIHELDADSVFVSTSTWEKQRKGNIYENLEYDAAIRYLAATFLNGNGRAVGDKSREQPVKITVPTKTGAWELKNYSDDFGEPTENKYLVLMGEGVFSNSATSNSRLQVVFFIDGDNFSFRLFEYGSSPVKDDDHAYVTRIKDSEGVVHDFRLWNSGQSGQIGSMILSQSDYNEIVEILKKGGEIIVTMKYSSYSDSDYRFKLDVDGFDNAIKYVK